MSVQIQFKLAMGVNPTLSFWQVLVFSTFLRRNSRGSTPILGTLIAWPIFTLTWGLIINFQWWWMLSPYSHGNKFITNKVIFCRSAIHDVMYSRAAKDYSNKNVFFQGSWCSRSCETELSSPKITLPWRFASEATKRGNSPMCTLLSSLGLTSSGDHWLA